MMMTDAIAHAPEPELSMPDLSISGLFAASPDDIAPYLEQLRRADALGMPLLSEAGRLSLLEAANALTYRRAKPYMGAPGKEVQQDFEICMTFDDHSPFVMLAEQLGAQLRAAARVMAEPPLTDALQFNDIAVQRYIPGSAGITPHRDFPAVPAGGGSDRPRRPGPLFHLRQPRGPEPGRSSRSDPATPC